MNKKVSGILSVFDISPGVITFSDSELELLEVLAGTSFTGSSGI